MLVECLPAAPDQNRAGRVQCFGPANAWMDNTKHFTYFRMTAGHFDDLVSHITPFIQHTPTHIMPVTVPETPAVTLRLLASGSSQTAVGACFKLGSSTVSSIVSEVTKAIWQAQHTEFMAFPCLAAMEEIAKDCRIL